MSDLPTSSPPAAVAPVPVVITGTRGRSTTPRTTINSRPRTTSSRPQPRRVQQPVPPKEKDIVSSATTALMTILNEPTTMIFLGITFGIAYDYTENPGDNWLLSIAQQIGSDTPVGKFITSNAEKVIGAAMAVAGALGAPKGQRLVAVVGSAAAVLVYTRLSYMTYFIIAAALRIFFRTKDKQLRLAIVVACAIAVALSTNKSGKNTPVSNKGVQGSTPTPTAQHAG